MLYIFNRKNGAKGSRGVLSLKSELEDGEVDYEHSSEILPILLLVPREYCYMYFTKNVVTTYQALFKRKDAKTSTRQKL